MSDDVRDLLRRAYEAGYGQGLTGVQWADAEGTYKHYMFLRWVESAHVDGVPLTELLQPRPRGARVQTDLATLLVPKATAKTQAEGLHSSAW